MSVEAFVESAYMIHCDLGPKMWRMGKTVECVWDWGRGRVVGECLFD